MTNTAAPTLLYRVHLEDEMPAIGSGIRWVYAREGIKWVFVLCPYTVNTVRISLTIWRGVKRGLWVNSDRIQSVLQRQLDALDREPTAFELSALRA